ncbi:MAG: T9SS type A sorting domain-containing protein [Bacteroidales bacterium]|nr:T9SS type A sorting domain-containing protein [Bacteroidales bacterium]
MSAIRSIILCFFIILITRAASGQPWYFNELYNPNSTWAGGLSVIGTDDGYFGCAISSDSVSGYFYNTCTFFLNHEGEMVFWKNFGMHGYDWYPGWDGSLKQAGDYNYALFGSRRNLSIGKSTGAFYLFDAEGDTVFTRTFISETGNTLIGRTCAVSICGGFALLGQLTVGEHLADIVLIKTDSLANEIWRKQYDVSNLDRPTSIIQTPDNGFALGGLSYVPGQQPSTQDPFVIKTDSMGNFEWSLNLGGPFKDDHAMLCNTPDSCIVALTAYADSMYTPDYGYARINLVKIDLEGNIIWNKKYGPSKPKNLISNITALDNGDLVACGYARYSTYLNPAGWLFRFDANGDSLWYRDYYYFPANQPEYGRNYLYDLSITSDNGIVAIGQAYTSQQPNNVQRMWVLKVDSVGCETPNCWVGIEDGRTVGRYEGEEVGVRVWPNPVREVLSVKVLGLSEGLVYSLEIYDIFGRKAPGHIASLPPGGGRAGDGGWTVDVSGLVPGTYLAVVRDKKHFIGSAKFVVVR